MTLNGEKSIPNGKVHHADENEEDERTLLAEQTLLANDLASSEKGFPSSRKQLSRKSTFTLPRSWSFWRLKSMEHPVSKSEMEDLHQARSTPDDASRTSERPLKRSNSFKTMMKRFRKYKSTESLQGSRRRAKPPAEVHYIEEVPGRITVPVLGLQNHGNSCYINAVMQCLNNTAQIYQFFVSGTFKRDLANRNRENSKKFGTNGHLTEACGALIRSLGRATYDPSVSEALIQIVAKYWNQFHDGGEQDAQEFLLWLLDKMHEDLNKSRKKKLKIKKSNIPDDFLAANTEKASGNSYISRLYHALFRSSLTCRQCGQQSNTFDPFACLSLPLPQVDMRSVFVNFISMDCQSDIIRFGFSTSVDCSVKDVKQLVAQKTSTRADELLVLELNNEGFQRTLFNDESSDVMQDCPNDLFAIELTKISLASPEREMMFLVLLHVTIKEKNRIQRLSAPRVMCVPREFTYEDLEVEILANLTTRPIRGAQELRNAQEIPPRRPWFRLHLFERDEYLSSSVDHPFYMDSIDECLSLSQNVSAYQHLKIYVEWEKDVVEYFSTRLLREYYSDDVSVSAIRKLPESATKTSLTDCLELYMQNEQIGLDGPWECPNCGALQAGITKKQTLWTLPEIMVIHLKRFRQSSTTRFKLTSMVDFPLEHLDMTRFMTKTEDLDPELRLRNGYRKKHSWFSIPKPRKPPGSQTDQINTYSLFGVVNHHGKLNSGHYTAYCRHPSDGRWYLYDDLKVKTVVDPSEVVTKDAYLLFYQRDPLETFPVLYYEDYAQTQSFGSYRSSPALRSRSNENIPQSIKNEDDRHQDEQEITRNNSFTRTAQLYASLPRQLRRVPVVHPVTPPSPQLPSLVPAPLNNGHQAAPTSEYYYERHRAIPVVAPPEESSIMDNNLKVLAQVPRLQRPVQESCV